MSVLQHTEATFEPLPFDTEAARTFGLVSAAVVAAGRKPHRRIRGNTHRTRVERSPARV
jgi:hypothetical protein